ncbi:mediator of RNA polymerase II transcription subunit 1-domain-containing protein [Xylariales sp. PMI_506]|nr:mediator of RNA polymerase II transcription subunit 1-domain-containing protein [Xylariales sp. PMI_506]
MSTPMRHGPSQQGRTPSQMMGAAPTPPVSTPFSNPQTQAAFSPPQGSRTSPQTIKKSPATSQTLKGMPDGGAAVNFDSPSATAALGALGIHGNLDLGLDHLSMGSLGIGRADEDDRKKRMEALVAMLKAGGKGRVSNEGLERVARSIGLECLWEDTPGGGPKSKTLFIAGHGLTLEIIINNHIVENVALTFPECTSSVQQHVGEAADILLRDLKLAPGQATWTKTLDKFQPNLERLATLDRLSVLPSLNCYDAISGIYESLLKIHNWDVAKLREDPKMKGKPDEYIKVTALCSRHGCPLMHARDRIGLSFDYWKERKRMPSTTVHKDAIKTWAIMIECAPKSDMAIMPEMVGIPVRVSEHWISDAIEKTENLTNDEMLSTAGPILDWQEPDHILLPSEAGSKPPGAVESDPTAVSEGPKLPDVFFMATFDPPLIVTSAVAAQIHGIAGTPVPESSVTFDALVFPIVPGSIYDPSEPRIITRLQPVSSFYGAKPGEEEKHIRSHKNTLCIYKPVYGQVLTKVPMQHPRQLMDMLPMLRQFAFLSTLLAKSFKPKEGFPELSTEITKSTVTKTAANEFASFMGSDDAAPSQAGASSTTVSHIMSRPDLDIDVTLTAHPVPRLVIVFPFRDRTANITLEIQLGGKVHIVSDNVFGTDEDGDKEMEGASASKGKGKRYEPAQWADMLEITEDIGAWVEYIKFKLE